jgi:chromosome segregation ATPase
MAQPQEKRDEFGQLEARIVELIDRWKKAEVSRRSAGEEAERLRAELRQRVEEIQHLERELNLLRREREDVRARIEKLIGQMDALSRSP